MSYESPNFSIVMSGGCNSHCSFCTDSFNRKASPDYLSNLTNILFQGLPAQFDQCSITGGEPTLSKDLPAVLSLVKMSRQFRKVVLTTNGAKLKEHLNVIKSTVNHVNVSRHAVGYAANTNVFGTADIINDEDLADVTSELNKAGIDVNLNFVYRDSDELDEAYVNQFIIYARSLGATSVSFRYDQNQNTLDKTYLERIFEDWKVINEGGCPVCRNHTVLINGMPVVFKASYAEPSKAIDSVFELIYGITGKLTTDWEGKREFTPAMAAAYQAEYEADPHKQHKVVEHTVTSNTPAARGLKAQAPAVKVVSAPKDTRSRANTQGRTFVPVNVERDVKDAGGGCGGMGGFGGGCGKG